MRLRTFTAEDMQLAMHMVRESLGDEAIIISTKQAESGFGVQVTAAFDDMYGEDDASDDNPDNMKWYASLAGETSESTLSPAPPVPFFRDRSDATVPERTAQRIERILVHHGFNDPLIDYLMGQLDALTTNDVSYYKHVQDITARWLTALIASSFPTAPLEVKQESFRHILIGTPGAGKTLTTAKIAASCVKAGKPVHVITTDNKRAGGVEQLAAITDILGIELLVAESRQSLKAILSDIVLAETVIVDSAGANPYDFYELKTLAEYAGLIELDPILVYPSGSDPLEADEVARAFSFIGVEKMIVTRTDTARRFGSIFNAAHAGGLKFANVTGSEKILGTFDTCTADYLTKLLMDYQPEEG
jgi:flagellar biosynthesis protein FlhF